MEEVVSASLMDIVLGAGIILGMLMGIAGVIVKLTKTQRDDAFLVKVRKVVGPILVALRGSKGSTKG